MKRSICALILTCSTALVFAQNGPIDLILLLDTSSSMSASWNEVNSYISGPFLKEFLRTGDTFHLLPFSDQGRLDFVRRIESRGDVEVLIGRLFLQYPIDEWSDIPRALSYVENYTATLPSRPKKIVLISDGDTVLPPFISRGTPDAAGLSTLIDELKTRLSYGGITLDFVRVVPGKPLANLPRSGRTQTVRPASSKPAARPAASALPSPPVPAVEPPQTAKPVEPPVTVQTPPPVAVEPPQTTKTVEPPVAAVEPSPPPVQPVSESSAAQAEPPAVQIEVPPPTPQSPPPIAAPVLSPKPVETETDSLDKRFFLLPLATYIAALFFLVAGLIVFFAVHRWLWKNSSLVAAAAVSCGSAVDEGFLNLFVADQNTFIGRRNIHALKSGYSLTVGGGKSDFLIFLAPMPQAIGEVRRLGGSYTFIPRKSRFFPDLGSKELPDCVGKTIKALSGKNREVRFTLERYGKPSS